jgi:hypothetical protein
VPRRVRVPAPDELFRPTVVPAPDTPAEPGATPAVTELAVVEAPAPEPRAASGRVRHEEKMTVYVTSEELLDLEDARLALRRTHRIAVDRGRLVRAAVALALADLDAQGADSALVRRLSEG